MAEKKVKMVMKVDLQCYRCYKKIKKVMCKFPEIRDQIYDEQQNRVTISVVSCCPVRILQKIASKGGKTVESIEIVPEEKPDKKDSDKPEADKKKDVPAAGKPKGGDVKVYGQKEKPVQDPKGSAGSDSNDPPQTVTDKHTAGPVSGYSTIYPSGMYYQPPQLYYQGYGSMSYYHGVPAYYGESSYSVNRGYNTNHANYLQ